MVTFSDYYRQKMTSATPPQGSSSLPKYDFSGLSGVAKKAEEAKPYGPLDTIIDLLSRPLYGVTNAVTGVSEGIAEAREGNPLAAAGGIAAIPTNFLSSFFGTSGEEGKRTFSTVLEQQTDRHGKINDPNYQDTENNVDPVLKGVLGFVGDVGLDPLTYIPGAQIAKVGGLIAKGGKAAVKGAETAVKGAEDLIKSKRAAEPVAKAIDDAEEANVFGDGFLHEAVPGTTETALQNAQRTVRERITPELDVSPGAVEAWAKSSNIPEVGKAWTDYNVKLAKASKSLSGNVPASFGSKAVAEAEQKLTSLYKRHQLANLPVKTAPVADRTWTEMFKGSNVSAGAEAVRGEITSLLSKIGESAPVEVKPINEWVRENSKLNLFDTPTQVSPGLNNLLRAVQSGSTPGSVGRLARIVGNSQLPREIRAEAFDLVKRLHAQSQTAVKTDVTDALAAFNLRRSQDETAVRSALGDKLFDFLSRKADSSKTTAQSFEKVLRDIGRVSDPNVDMGVIAKMGQRNAETFGAPTTAFNAYTDALGLPRYVSPEANSPEAVAAATDAVISRATAANEAVAKVFRTTVHGDEMKQKYPVRRGNTRATDVDREVATNRFVRQLNTFFQYDLNKALVPALKARMVERTGIKDPSEIAGLLRSAEWRNATYEHWDSIAQTMSDLGLKMHIGVGTQELVPLSFPDILRITEDAFANPQLSQAVLFNGGTAVAPTRLMEAVHYLVTTGARDDQALVDVAAILQNKKVSGYRGQTLDKEIANNNLKDGAYAHFTGKSGEKSAREYALATGGRVVPNSSKTGWYVKAPKGGFSMQLAEALVRGADGFAARAAENRAAYAARGVSEARSLTTTEINRMQKFFVDSTFEEQMQILAKRRGDMVKDAQEIGAFPSSVDAAEAAVKAVVGTFEETRARHFMSMAEKIKAEPKARKVVVAENAAKQAEEFGKQADDVLDFDDVIPVAETEDSAGAIIKAAEPDIEKFDIAVLDKDYGLKELAAREGFTGSALGIWDKARQLFDQRYGMDTIFDIYHRKRSVAGQFMTETDALLRPLARFTPDQLRAAVRAVQDGSVNADPAIAEAMTGIEKAFSRIFDTGRSDSILNSPLLRTEPNIDHINSVIANKFGKKLKDLGYVLDEEAGDLANQWRSWDIQDPMHDLFVLSDAFATIVEQRSIVGNFLFEMGKSGLVSREYKPGMVKVADSGGSIFARLIPEGVYMRKEAAAELRQLDVMMRTDRHFKADLGQFLEKSFIPAQNLWKQAVTVYRPGHHVRNEMSNDFMSYIARGHKFYLRSQKDAMKVLGLKNEYEGANLIESLSAIGERIPVGSDTIVAGKRMSFTADEIAKIFQDAGLKRTFKISEDLMQDQARGKLADLGVKMTNSRTGQFVGNISHLVDHKGMMQHLIQILHQEASGVGKWGKLSKDELIKRAVREVKRSHPDALMLTPFEAKWRWLIPFYTWFAKTLPFALESAARNPGRFMQIPKASYALATSMGINPYSLSDPFPDDQLFPSFVTEQAFGPQFEIDGKYINVNPGVPQFDLLQTLAKGPEGLLEMTSPLLRVPAELATGSKVGGQKINDTSDYLDQNIPIVNYLANMTGTSVTGSAVSALQGQGLDPQAQVARGNKDSLDQALSVINWLTGVNAQNWSRPNYINYAEIEKRNAANDKKGSGF